MEFHQLRYFVAVAEEKSFSRAAERMRVAQPSLSQQIQKLESELGHPLFDRLTRGTALTEAGARLLSFARKILTEAADARRCLDEFRDETTGTVTLGVIPTIAPYILRPLLDRFREMHPKVSVEVAEDVTDNLLRAVEDGEVDLALISTCRSGTTAARQLIGSEPLVAALPANHPLVGQRTITPKAIASERFVMLHETHCLSKQIERWGKQHGIRPQNTLPAVQLSTVVAMIAAGQGVSIIPAMAVPHEQGRGCAFIPFRSSTPAREINLIRNPARHSSRAAAAFSTAAQGTLSEILSRTVCNC